MRRVMGIHKSFKTSFKVNIIKYNDAVFNHQIDIIERGLLIFLPCLRVALRKGVSEIAAKVKSGSRAQGVSPGGVRVRAPRSGSFRLSIIQYA